MRSSNFRPFQPLDCDYQPLSGTPAPVAFSLPFQEPMQPTSRIILPFAFIKLTVNHSYKPVGIFGHLLYRTQRPRANMTVFVEDSHLLACPKEPFATSGIQSWHISS